VTLSQDSKAAVADADNLEGPKMAPVAPIPCLMPDCTLGEDGGQYWTDVYCQSHIEARALMRDHIQVHSNALEEIKEARAVAAAAIAAAAVLLPAGPGPAALPRGAMTEKISRPRISEGTDDIQWATFCKQFTRYKRVTGVLGQAATDQLWYCMSESLEDAVTQDGSPEDITEVALLAKIKKLAVRRANILVNQSTFLKLGQDKGEDCGAFVARLRGAAQVANFLHQCPHCEVPVSYSDRMIAHQLVVALVDDDIQEKILSQVANQTPTLAELITMIEAQESGKRSHDLLQAGTGSLNRLSEYRKQKEGKGSIRGPPGPLGVVNPQASPPAVLGDPQWTPA
jgi:hypothetical protein